MKYLNLTTGYNPNNARDEDLIKFESFTFSGGEPHIKLESNLDEDGFPKSLFDNIKITIKLNSFNDIGLLLMAVDALKREYQYENLFLVIPYFPGARQDRIMVPGEPLSVKVYANIINSLGFNTVTILDPHSDVTPALLNNCLVKNNYDFIDKATWDIGSKTEGLNGYCLISPDAGANKKIMGVARHLGYGYKGVVKCDKTRNPKTGEIIKFEVYTDDLKGRDCIIIDDICDGGGTFLGLAEKLKQKNAGNIHLIVTHGIFSKGLDAFEKNFHSIYTTDSFDGQRSDKVTEIKITM